MQGEQKQRRVKNFTAENQAEKKLKKILKKCLTNRKQSDIINHG